MHAQVAQHQPALLPVGTLRRRRVGIDRLRKERAPLPLERKLVLGGRRRALVCPTALLILVLILVAVAALQAPLALLAPPTVALLPRRVRLDAHLGAQEAVDIRLQLVAFAGDCNPRPSLRTHRTLLRPHAAKGTHATILVHVDVLEGLAELGRHATVEDGQRDRWQLLDADAHHDRPAAHSAVISGLGHTGAKCAEHAAVAADGWLGQAQLEIAALGQVQRPGTVLALLQLDLSIDELNVRRHHKFLG